MSALAKPAPHAAPDPLLVVAGLRKYFPIRGGVLNRVQRHVHAVEDVSFTVNRGEVVGLVGESGSGKTTVGRTILRLETPTAGSVSFAGTDLGFLGRPQMRAMRKRMQIVFQDPYASLNPREKIRTVLAHALSVHDIVPAREREGRVVQLLEQVGLSADYLDRFPHEFSGGQRQRIGIARALAVEPDFIVADEPVSALDVSIQGQVINLLQDLKDALGLTMLFIAHDLAVVEHISDRVIVMYLGRIMEVAPTRTLYAAPNHPYTQALLSAVPQPDPDRRPQRTILTGDIPSPISPPSGCVFRTRCPQAIADCASIVPELRPVSPGQFSACIRTAP
ncbi:ABC transporter ATP-binding protein [Aureimonas jatrophae]|uniref:Peptide/nickel transport system ATP-binding protein/oligopeptide transport system ATP-binding protein n=1 Tax=Aureimonas jatrophae TaxID=1166073 RepID=A0A1H0FIT8_9HYPH|nr:ABC transporter ATP-binding protein [Aureimonas jatrophae]MBB3950004.1 oligopeptide/dipeptide ABC transporter ATP-binding protein [Aureimonas jatrophae]SDN94401.1 peptide/nickel transport system ATP-binding protein/oligopeptide transport system ATP-binding protein [Aureimonas jatrophae]